MIAVGVMISGSTFFGFLSPTVGFQYLGTQTNVDDHMVYAAWMHQALEGRLLFDNRFAIDPQPGLTFHVYFLIAGWLAKLVTIPVATNVLRVAFSVSFIWMLGRFVRRLEFSTFGYKLALGIAVFGGGFGFLTWTQFGDTIPEAALAPWSAFLLGRQPIDVWQPEAFVLSSLLTNGLFAVSLVLILATFRAVLEARSTQKAVLPGVVAFGLLMNIHSYDALLVTVVLVGLLVASTVVGQADGAWIKRSLLIGLGAIPAALWFVYVLRNDPVFQARAATETFSPNLRQVLGGLGFMIPVGLAGIVVRAEHTRQRAGALLYSVLLIGLTVAAGNHTSGYFLSPIAFGIVFLVALAAVGLLAEENSGWNLILSWALLGLVAIYFPALFQRKLAMAISLPWALLTARFVAGLIQNKERSARNLTATFAILLVGGSSLSWLVREMQFITANVSSTTRHPVVISPDIRRIVEALNAEKGRTVVLAIPGSGNPLVDDSGKAIPGAFGSPLLPDIAPILSGLAGVYTYAGHWSETPEYTKRASDMYRFLFVAPIGGIRSVMTPDERNAFVAEVGATFAVVPLQEAYPSLPLVNPSDLGEVTFRGTQFALVRLRRSQ